MNLKKIRSAFIKASYRNRALYDILNAVMTYQANRQQTAQYQSTVDREQILVEQDLELVKTGFFRQKETVSRVKDKDDNCFILKTGGIDPFQKELFRVAKSLEKTLSFKVPALVRQGDGWILLEEIKGRTLSDFYREKPDSFVQISKEVADDYQRVIAELQREQDLGDLLVDGQEWLFSRLSLWSKPIVDAGLIDFSLVQQLKRDFETVIAQKGEDFFGWVHGNIIDDHLMVSGENVYLLDLNVVPRAGRGYYDFLRALDFMFLKSENEDWMFTIISRWVRQYLAGFNGEEVKLVFAFRNIGALGWDILHHHVEYTKGDLEKKKKLMIKFIQREWRQEN